MLDNEVIRETDDVADIACYALGLAAKAKHAKCARLLFNFLGFKFDMKYYKGTRWESVNYYDEHFKRWRIYVTKADVCDIIAPMVCERNSVGLLIIESQKELPRLPVVMLRIFAEYSSYWPPQ
jgi:hypothetical protein